MATIQEKEGEEMKIETEDAKMENKEKNKIFKEEEDEEEWQEKDKEEEERRWVVSEVEKKMVKKDKVTKEKIDITDGEEKMEKKS